MKAPMKKNTAFIILLLMPVLLSAQHMVVAPTVEKTIDRYQYGTSLSLEIPAQWRFGGFYQTSLSSPEHTSEREHFWGLTIYAPLMKADRITFYGNARVGIVNKYFMVVSPAVITELKIFGQLHLDVGLSVRKGYLSAQTSLNIKI